MQEKIQKMGRKFRDNGKERQERRKSYHGGNIQDPKLGDEVLA